jgi:poly(3-hydroxybutyrate) depolymerase
MHGPLGRIVLVVAVLVLVVPTSGLAQEIVLDKMLVLDRVGRAGRSPVFVDPVEAMRVAGKWTTPKAGDLVTTADGQTVAWRDASAGEDGWISGASLAGGYALATVESESDRVMILEASGHGMVFVNGEPRAGDPYGHGYVRLPVLLKAGANELLFTVARGRVRATLTTPKGDVYPDLGDATAPDFIKGVADSQPFGVVYVNATTQPVSSPARIPPLSVRKVRGMARYDGTATELKDERTGVTFRIREPGQTYKRTFVSDIDGSVQYYAVNPRSKGDEPGALVLSLHGAAVEATNQADAYSSKSWADIVCPTNRRPYGFDWEDWGRIDALEVLDDATRLLEPDPSRVYLTGHSMGGHGAWIVGALFPGRFAAIGPSAGWISFSTYASATRPSTQPASPLADLMRRASSASDTSLVFHNLAHAGVYILHGADDKNVPAAQARQMVEHLGQFHHDFVYHEQPKAGHWWESSDEPGAECVDWPAMFDFFARHRLPEPASVRQVDFVTVNPGASSRCQWVSIEAQQRAMRPSRVSVRVDPHQRRFVGTTENVERLAIDRAPLPPGGPVAIDIDGQKLEVVAWPASGRVWLERRDGAWRATDEPSPDVKNPRRCGPFKDAFRNRMLFVYGTRGTSEENAWALAKARFDAETFWYRGNGSVEVVPDHEFDPAKEPDCNVILYGNADTLACWGTLLGQSPVQVKRGEMRVGPHAYAGEDLASLFLRPRPNSDRACVAVIGGSGVVGMRATDRLPVFLSGVAFPDYTVLGRDVFERGLAAVRCAGFFGNDWSFERGECEVMPE